MADQQTNLHPKNNTTVNLKPNIVTENIPEKAVTMEKLDQSLQDTIRNHTSSIATNTEDIAKNKADIAMNTADIEKNTADIAKNTEDITENKADIEKNTADIAKNTEDITENKADITDNTLIISSLETKTKNLETRTKNLEDSKVIVNTGTFDPTSDNPASQKSIMDTIIEADLNARFSRVSSRNLSGAFGNLPSYYSGKFHLLRVSNFPWGLDFDFSRLFADTKIKEIDYSTYLNDVFEHAGAINMTGSFFRTRAILISATYSLRKVSNLNTAFMYCDNLKTIKLKDFPVSFDISASTQFEESDLVEILNNLMDLTGKTSQTLTMGATNLAKLTDEEKTIATNKNWTLA